jgi:hypothetical protein
LDQAPEGAVSWLFPEETNPNKTGLRENASEAADTAQIVQEHPTEAAECDSASFWAAALGTEIFRATRTWIQYGVVGFAVACIIIGAVKGLFGL